MNTNDVIKLDLKDRKIIRELDMNARISLNVLAKKVGVSHQIAHYKIEQLKRKGVILGTITIFDSAVVGQRWYRVILTLQKIQKLKKAELIEYLKKHPNLLWVGEVGGNWDLVINFVAFDQYEFNKLFERFLEKWGEYIQKYELLPYVNVRDQARKYILQNYDVEKTDLFHSMKYNPNVKIDEVDKKIIQALTKDARMSFVKIASNVGVNYKTVQERIKRMEEKHLILGYRLVVHPRAIGYSSHMLFLKVPKYNRKLERTLYEFLNHPNVVFVVKHLGTWRIGIEIETPSERDFQDFLIDLRTMFSEIISEYETFPIFKDCKMNYFPDGALNAVISLR